MLAGGASSAIFPVSATSDSDLEPDSSVQITTESGSGSGEDIELDGNLGGWDIKIDNSRKPDTKSDTNSDKDISVNGSGDGVTIKNNTESEKDDVKLEDAGDNNKPDAANKTGDAAKPAADTDADSKDIDITKPADALSASITRTDKNGSLDVDDAATLHVEAKNESENPAIFKMYFCDVREIKKGADLSTYLNKPARSCKVQGLSKECTLNVDVTGPDGKKTKSALEFLKEIEKEADKDKESGSERIVSRYAKLLVPAGSSVGFDFGITSPIEGAVTVIPVMVQETAVYGDAQSAEWEEEVTFFDHIVNFFTGKQPEKDKDDEGINISDVQGVSADVPEGLDEDDFASKRLMVLSDDPSVFEGKNNVIGQYGSLYLMQFDSVEAAMQAYDYYKDIVTAVEPDVPVSVASNAGSDKDAGDTDKEDAADTKDAGPADSESDADVDISATGEQASVNDGTEDANPEDNPINALNAVDASQDVKKERGVIALIDTGVGEHANVIERISVIDDNTSGNGGSHGDAMVSAIVSQDPEAKILSIKAMDDNGYGTVSALVAAMEYAIEQKVDIINLSLYARTTLATSVLKSEIEKAADAGIIVVGAAGNDGADVKDYMPGSVESAYIIGAANKDGYRQVLSNYGKTVDYNVAADTTSEASALFTGFVSAYGLDAVKGVLNKGLIYATDYKKDFFDFVEGEFKDGKSVTVKADGNVKVTVADVEAGVYHVYHVTDKENTILVPEKDAIHIGVCTEDEMYSMESVDVLDADKNKIAEAEIHQHSLGSIRSHVRNGFFDVSGKDLSSISVSAKKQEFPVSVYDEPSGFRYFESGLCSDGDCLNNHVRRVAPDGTRHTIFCDDEDCGHEVEHQHDAENGDVFHVACGKYGSYNQLCQTCIANYAAGTAGLDGGYPHDVQDMTGSTWNGTLTASQVGQCVYSDPNATFTKGGDVNYHAAGSVTINGIGVTALCANHGHMAPVTTTGSVYVYLKELGTNYAVFVFYFVTPDSAIDYQDFFGEFKITVAPKKGGLSIHKTSDAPSGNSHYSLSGAEFQIKSGSTVVWTLTTDGSGNASTGDEALDEGDYTLHESKAPKGHKKAADKAVHITAGQAASANVVEVKDDYKQGKIKVKKKSKNSNATPSTNSGYSYKNADYGVYKNKSGDSVSGKVDTITTDEDGEGTSGNLPLGRYYVKETDSSKGYGKDDTIYTVDVTEKSDGSVTTPTVNSKEPPEYGKIEVTKKSKNPAMTDGNSCYSYAGAKYGVYTDSNCTDKFGEITIAANGKGTLSNVPFGDYWVKELGTGEKIGTQEKSYSKGYYIDTAKHKVVVKSIAGDSTNTVKCTSEEPAMDDPLMIQITKTPTGENTSTIPDLTGTQFTVKYYDFTKDAGNVTLSDLSGKTPVRTWVVQTKKVGSRYVVRLSNDYKVSGDDFYTDEAGNPCLPLGTITVQETKPAPGYQLSNRGAFYDRNGNELMKSTGTYVTQIRDVGDAISMSGGNEYTMKNDPEDIDLKVIKYGPDGRPLAGVTYKITHKDGSAVTDKDGNAVGEKTTGADGTIEFKKLYPDEYLIIEVKTVDGMQLLAEPISIAAPMRMTREEAAEWHLDTSDNRKVIWSEAEGKYLIMKFTTEVTNHASFQMPMSGGTVDARTFIPLVLGMGVFAGIAFFLFYKKKKTVKAE